MGGKKTSGSGLVNLLFDSPLPLPTIDATLPVLADDDPEEMKGHWTLFGGSLTCASELRLR